MSAKPREECGIFGVFGHPEAGRLTYLGLYALQHRGQESAGIAIRRADPDGPVLDAFKGMGYVADVFPGEIGEALVGDAAIGHVRYSTAGASRLENTQPLLITRKKGAIALAHNGNLTNAAALRASLEGHGAIFATTTDTEVILHLLARSPREAFEDALTEALAPLHGAWSLLLLTTSALVAARDPHGFRPLALGTIPHNGGEAFCLSSETCAFDLVGARYVREVEPGEMLVIDRAGLHTRKPFFPAVPAPCIFEYVYFSRPDSIVFGRSVADVRRSFGHELAREHPAVADLVVPVPDSGNFAARGFAEASGIPYENGITRNHYVGRTFIEPKQAIRTFGVRVKLNPVRSLIQGKRVVLVDDSIVRGTTSKKIVAMVREAGAKEIHLRISCPPTTHPCYYGVDTPEEEELIASSHPVEEIRQFLGVESLGYLSLEGMLRAAGAPGRTYCTSCYTGTYPVPPEGSEYRRER